MDAKDYVVNEVLRDPRRFMVPIYQRRYQWGDCVEKGCLAVTLVV